MRNRRWILLWAILLSACQKGGELFKNPSAEKTGLDFVNSIQETDELNILDYLYFYNGGGVAIGDINNDGLPDVYLSGNQVKNKLFLNKGDLRFEDITERAGVGGNSSWNTGVTMVDINADGWLDIYVCAVVGINGFRGYNELFINNQDGTFTEKATEFGLDFDSYSSGAAFFDYDLDGDLDMFLLNHAVHTQESYGSADLRYKRNYETGDKLMRNDGGKFVEVSDQAGIYGGINGYGLGLAVADFNKDGYPDIFVGNDFHEDDYYYLNNGDGTFSEEMRKHFGHTSRFTMGSDVADINHDGWPDLVSLDMLPEDERALKASEGDDNIQTQKMRIQQYGYHYQFSRNMLYVNRPEGKFIETALMSGISATDWSWSSLFGDFDQDGYQDLFIANGIPRRPNDLDFVKFVSNDQMQSKLSNTKIIDNKALELMPSGTTANFIFKGSSNLKFENKSTQWIHQDTINSNAVAYADLDLDGDLDLVVNNLNSPAEIYENKTDKKANYITLSFKGRDKNTNAIGTKVHLYTAGKLHYRELQPTRGFQASSEPILHFGLGKVEMVDSLRVFWPRGTSQLLTEVAVNQRLVLIPDNDKPYKLPKPSKQRLFKKVEDNLGLNFVHKEDNYIDFNREKLIPYRLSDRGPAFAMGDLNHDGREDLFFGNSKLKTPQVYIQSDTCFVMVDNLLNLDPKKENISALISDFNADRKNDLITATGGGDFFGNSPILLDELWLQADTTFTEASFPEIFQNTSIIQAADYDKDGDLDIFLGGQSQTGNFGKQVQSYLLKNEGGTFSIDTRFELYGMVTDAVWLDFDGDDDEDLVVVGEWMSPMIFENNQGQLRKIQSPGISGLWQSVHPFDIDNDGDLDILLGNWGENTKFRASQEFPLRMYYADFDKNGQTETVTAIAKNDVYYPLETLDGLTGQMVSLRRKYNNYTSFAGQNLEEIFGKEALEQAKELQVNTLSSGYLLNDKGSFTFMAFPYQMQLAPIMDFCNYDFDGDGKEEVLAAGNYFGVKPYHGRLDSFPGVLIQNDEEITFADELGLDLMFKSVRHLKTVKFSDQTYLLVVYNDEAAEFYTIRP